MIFDPDEVMFSPGNLCNLSCRHCGVKKTKDTLDPAIAVRFLKRCALSNIKRVGFSGGEPFLYEDFLHKVISSVVRQNMLFSRIMTNGVWWKTRRQLSMALTALREARYDGEICVSVDAFHGQAVGKVAAFIKSAISAWKRPDIITIASVRNLEDKRTSDIMRALAAALGARILRDGRLRPVCMKSDSVFIRIYSIDFEPVGNGRGIGISPWSGRWFKEDRCEGPGNILFVLPDGNVRPCCGYADNDLLTIGNIKRDSPSDIIRHANRRGIVSAIFSKGLTGIRRSLERDGIRLPGKTPFHCFFCDFLLANYPKEVSKRCAV